MFKYLSRFRTSLNDISHNCTAGKLNRKQHGIVSLHRTTRGQIPSTQQIYNEKTKTKITSQFSFQSLRCGPEL
jgi:hypothetical protein